MLKHFTNCGLFPFAYSINTKKSYALSKSAVLQDSVLSMNTLHSKTQKHCDYKKNYDNR